jgi:hypothetical protein
MKISMEVSLKKKQLKIELPYDPPIPFLGTHPKEYKLIYI